ncbi:hypothetical protein L6R50_26995 [Myxococcota bacterium]|nr:hypothetical protein [Myxococcota bacterium]
MRDAERLGVTHLRQVGDGDTYYDTLWVGCADYSGGLHGEDNVWYALPSDFPGTGHGWFCSPSSGDLETVWDLGAPCGAIVVAPVCPTEGPVLEEDEGGGPFTLLCGFPTASGQGSAPPVLVSLLRDLVVDSGGRSLTILPVLYGRSDRESGAERGFDWGYVGANGVITSDGQSNLISVFERDGKEDRLAREFLRQLFSDAGLWGMGQPLTSVQYGNELEGVVPPEEIAWLVLRTALDLSDCAPASVRRLFPALYSPSTTGTTSPPDEYIEGKREQVEQIFFELVRAVLILQAEDVTDDPDLGTRLDALLGTPTGIPLADLWPAFTGLLTLFEGIFGTGRPIPSGPADLDRDDPAHRALLKVLTRANLRAPFDVLDFHWYACWDLLQPSELPGAEPVVRFFFLSKANAYLNGPRGLRALVDEWWSGGDAIDLWCSETGISSDASPFLRPDVPPDQITYGLRVDPETVRALTGSDDPACWPEWVFTSEREQARQLWMRLCYLAALGVKRVLWYANQSEERNLDGGQPEFYAFGLTSDTLDDENEDYLHRRKKLGFCALRRWNEYLERFVSAEVALGLDGESPGLEGFYGVLFRRSPDSAAAAAYDTDSFPYALVLWADTRSYDWSAYATGCDRTAPPPPARSLRVYVRTSGGANVPSVVATVPTAEARTDAFSSVCTPCVESGQKPVEGLDGDDFQGPELLRFEPARSLSPTGDPASFYVDVEVDQDPLLVLLPECGLSLEPITGPGDAQPGDLLGPIAYLPFSLQGT